MKKIITNSEQETFDFAREYAKNLKGGEVIGLVGELGSGKTIFSKGIAAGLGVEQNVTSPTFVIMKIYSTKNHKTINTLCHVDAYKISETDLESLGIQEYIESDDTVTIVEWIENVSKNIDKNIVNIEISHTDKSSRQIWIKK